MPILGFLGDVMLGRGVDIELRRRPPESLWGTVGPVLRSADTVFANLECAITSHIQEWRQTPKVFHFRASPAAIDVLRAGNIGCVSLANNHTLDFEVEGLLDTLRLLDQAGIAHAGAGRNLAEAQQPALVDVAGLRVALVSATDNEPPFTATPNRPGTWYMEISYDPDVPRSLAAAAEAARNSGARLVVLSVHWGPNMISQPTATFRRFAGQAMEFADLLHGHSAHVFQGVETRPGRLILYDTGDFLDDYAVDPELRNDWSFVFLVDVSLLGRPERLRLFPVRLDYAQVNLAVGEERDEICDCMVARSAPLGVKYQRRKWGLELVLNGAATS
ncbi:MAG TPA: CapA family protein [Gemmatimonadales bacterium]